MILSVVKSGPGETPHPGATPGPQDIERFLQEDIENQDLTAALLPENTRASAVVVSREAAILCGTAWFDAVFRTLSPEIVIQWQACDGDRIEAGSVLCALEGPAAPLMTGERTALNLLQTLSGTATLSRQFAERVQGSNLRVLDTRKTLPGLRLAQKYAVRVGGCHNHRLGLYDGVLIKENHIRAAGSIKEALKAARDVTPPGIEIEIEVENLQELDEALASGARRILIDNFSPEMRAAAVTKAKGLAKLEVSGNLGMEDLNEIARSGVDYVSIGALTKNLRAVDLSMQVTITDRP